MCAGTAGPAAAVRAVAVAGIWLGGCTSPLPAPGQRMPPPAEHLQALASSRALRAPCIEPHVFEYQPGYQKPIYTPGSDGYHRGKLPAAVRQKWPS